MLSRSFYFGIGLLVLSACSQSSHERLSVPVLSGNPNTQVTLGDSKTPFVAASLKVVRDGIASGRLLPARAALGEKSVMTRNEDVIEVPQNISSNELVLGFPKGLLGEQQVFGGVITAVSEKENEELGGLKLTDLPPVHVTAEVTVDENQKPVLALLGCAEKCEEGVEPGIIQTIPILAVDEEKQLLYLDLGAIADELNLIKMLDPKGEYTKLTTKEAKTVSLDFSLSTLVFDVRVKMVPLPAATPVTAREDQDDKEVDFNVRWYLRLASKFDPSFKVRESTKGVGFFMTERSVVPKLQRFSLSRATAAFNTKVHYYIKNVPEKFQKVFAGAFDEWNEAFKKNIGREVLTYEFVSEVDPRSALLVAGDPRYNILEWDLVNHAGYGGLGPSIANQFTGEILTANVLIQGPKIVELYTKWFELSQKVRELENQGQKVLSQRVLQQGMLSLQKSMESKAPTFQVTLGRSLNLRVTSQLPTLEDPLFQKEDFDAIPEGLTFDTYMPGYFHDMVAHELGHNLGLRHNFRGSLYAEESENGRPSLSIMEYLGRRFRYRDHIGAYDEMAIRYGYAGILPNVLDAFCTDEDVPTATGLTKSAECSRDDATQDSYGYFSARLRRALGFILGEGSNAPEWKVEDMERELKATVPGLGLYAATAETTASTWTNFFKFPNRPADGLGVKPFVLADLQSALCGDAIDKAVAAKATEEIASLTKANVEALRKKVAELLAPLKVFTDAELACN